ncbi:follistatin isoform X2 [Panulirus ornatus]|uniref:follistatin isoform X2 n=1 Tax=Panulirus ornatus TaxID=150431 RepID=UPI003A87C5E7
MTWRRKLLTGHPQVLVLLMLALQVLQVTADVSDGEVGDCWRLKRRDGSCGRLLKSGVNREVCCLGRHRRGWSTTSTSVAGLKPFNASASEEAGGQATCTPCTMTCAGVRCGEDRKCVVRCGAPRCVCSPQCHLKHKEAVCGSDGRTYKSECHLLKRACRKKKRLMVAHYGPCQTCSGVRCGGGRKCVLDEQMTPRCVRCPTTCPRLDKARPLCAADGHTYTSPCHLKRASCRAAAHIPRAYKGPCRDDASCGEVRCWRDQRCLTHDATGRPQCTSCSSLDSCRPSSRPVCASDGRTYPSWCAFRHEACRSGRALTPTLHHHCTANHTQPDDCNKQHYRTKKNKYQRHRERMREEQNELRQKMRTQTVLHEVAEAAGTSVLPEFNVGENPNSIKSRGTTLDSRSGSDSVSDKRKKRKRRRRRRRRSKNNLWKYIKSSRSP